MTRLNEAGFYISEIYSLVSKDSVQLIPRDSITYVSASDNTKPVYLVIAVIAIIFGLYLLWQASRLGGPPPAFGGLAIFVGIVFLIAFFGSRRVGVVVASSGGRIFIETKGRKRLDLIQRIFDDLNEHRPGWAFDAAQS